MAGKHTAGPWYGRPHFNPIMVQGASEVGLELAFACGGGNPNRDEYQANARLIAAAPDLLDQHEADMEDLALLLHAINEGDPKAELVMRVEDMKRRKRAAIARATQPLPPPNEE